MSKRRSIWPDLLTDRRRRKTSMGAMCLYYDLLMCTDDQGIYPLDVDKIILEVIPYFRGDDEEVVSFLHELIENKFIETYFPEGHKEEFLVILDWHQQGVLSSEHNKYPNKQGIVNEGKKRLGGMQRVGVIKTLAIQNDYTCSKCSKRVNVDDDRKITDLFTIVERINAKSRGSKYAENYNLICKCCSKTHSRNTQDACETQCVTSADSHETHIGIRDKGLGIRDNNKQEVANAPVAVEVDEPQYPFLKKIAKKYHSDVIEALFYWSEEMGKSVAPEKPSKTNDKRARLIAKALSEGLAPQEFKNAVRGCKSSTHHMGQNEQGRKYNDIEYILRPNNLDAWKNYGGEGRPMNEFEQQEERFKDPNYLNQLCRELGMEEMFGKKPIDGEVISREGVEAIRH